MVVQFTAHPHGGPESLWFHFRIHRQGNEDGRLIELRLVNCANLLGGHRPADFSPVIRVDGRPWQRIGRGVPVEHPDGRVDAVWHIKPPVSYADVATCYPYDASDLDELVRQTGLQRATIGVSQGGRAIDRLANRVASEAAPAPIGLYFIARQHSAETPGSWVLEGILRELSALNDPRIMAWAVPLSNIDGVVQGDYGKDNFPYDLNRAWGMPPMRHETLCISQDVRRWRKRCRRAAFIDLHAPGLCEADGFYAFVPCADNAGGPDNEALCRTLQQSLKTPLASEKFIRTANYPSRWTTPNATAFATTLPDTFSLSIESPYSYANGQVLTPDEYAAAGQGLLQGLVKHLSHDPPADL